MTTPKTVAIIGAGPAGLMAAETLASSGVAVTVHERMPSPGRKFLMAGRGGLNLTHSEGLDAFLARYGAGADWIASMLEAFPPADIVGWAQALGQPTFVGSSGRVFPKAMKASPLLRAWIGRLTELGVAFRLRHEWTGWTEDGALAFRTPSGTTTDRPDATVLALGGASWPRLGSTGAWAQTLAARGVALAPFGASNAGLVIGWSDHFRDRFAGSPLKGVALAAAGRQSRGEAMVTRYGLEGGAVYALAGAVGGALDTGPVTLDIDLRPDLPQERLAERLAKGRTGDSVANMLRKRAGLAPAAAALLRETGAGIPRDPLDLAKLIKRVSLPVKAVAPVERAISTTGGVALAETDARLMLKALPGVFVAGEMLDWDAPTGGYLLTACLATGRAAAKGVLDWMEHGRT
jgi:uncharacterized flavoprotein (TIGR03862 family)